MLFGHWDAVAVGTTRTALAPWGHRQGPVTSGAPSPAAAFNGLVSYRHLLQKAGSSDTPAPARSSTEPQRRHFPDHQRVFLSASAASLSGAVPFPPPRLRHRRCHAGLCRVWSSLRRLDPGKSLFPSIQTGAA